MWISTAALLVGCQGPGALEPDRAVTVMSVDDLEASLRRAAEVESASIVEVPSRSVSFDGLIGEGPAADGDPMADPDPTEVLSKAARRTLEDANEPMNAIADDCPQ